MKEGTEIVAATLLKVWETQGLLDTIMFAAAGDAVAGVAGSYVGAALAPKNIKLRWRLLQKDGAEYTVTVKGGDPRNDQYDLLPSIEDYKGWQSDSILAAAANYDSSSWAESAFEGISGVPFEVAMSCAEACPEGSSDDGGSKIDPGCARADADEGTPLAERVAVGGPCPMEPLRDGGTTIGAGVYRFGVNIPEGVYDLKLLSGSGILTVVDGERFPTCVYMDNDNGARSYKGLSNAGCTHFELSGSLVLFIERAQMLNI